MSDWQNGRPPSGRIVEVDKEGQIVRVRAIWGRDGLRPHWESEDGDTLYSPSAFSRWREVVRCTCVHAAGAHMNTLRARGCRFCGCSFTGIEPAQSVGAGDPHVGKVTE